MNFYGIEWDIRGPLQGLAGVVPEKMLGAFGARYHVFDSKKGRDAWVQNKSELRRVATD